MSRFTPSLLGMFYRSVVKTPAERAAYAALDNLAATWSRRNSKLKQSFTKTIQGGVTLEQLRRQHADRRPS